MARISQIKAVLLEEAILFLLRDSAYQPVREIPNINAVDQYLENGSAGINVLGRGESHQVDAIADFIFTPPFTNPLRLLCESKYREQAKVGIEVVRNAVGVKKDVEEYFRPNRADMPAYRHHYQYAVISTTGFTDRAQNYAFAQDIYLLDLNSDVYHQGFLDLINIYVDQIIIQPLANDGHRIQWNTDIEVDLRLLKEKFSEALDAYL